MAVHDVEMYEIGPGRLDRCDLFAEARHIGRKHRRRDRDLSLIQREATSSMLPPVGIRTPAAGH